MGQRDQKHKKVDVSRPTAPLQFNPFAALGEVEALKNLAPAPEPAKPVVPAPSVSPSPNREKAPKFPPNSRGRVILRRETKDRGGKVVVVIYGLDVLPGANAVMIADLAKDLKGRLGCGGSFDRREIVLQGDRCADVCAALEALGFRVDGVRS